MLITEFINWCSVTKHSLLSNLEYKLWKSITVSTSYRPWLTSINNLSPKKKFFLILFGSLDKKSKYTYLPAGVYLESYISSVYPKTYWLRKSYLCRLVPFTSDDQNVNLFNYNYDSVYIIFDDKFDTDANYIIFKELQSYFSILIVNTFFENSIIYDNSFVIKLDKSINWLKQVNVYKDIRVSILYNFSKNENIFFSAFLNDVKTNSRKKYNHFFQSSDYIKRYSEHLTVNSSLLNSKIESAYKKFYKSDSWNVNKFYWNFLRFKNNSIQFFKIDFSYDHIVNKFKAFSKPTDLSTQIDLFNTHKEINLSLRKNKIFNKGRYSRNRQLYRTGVYWSIWLNIILVFGLYYYFYRFTFNFAYVWLPLCIFIISLFFGRLVKYRLYNILNILTELTFFSSLLSTYFLPTLYLIPDFILDSYVSLIIFFKKKFKYSEKTVLERLQSRNKIRLDLQAKSGLSEANSTPAKILKKRLVYVLWSHYYTYIYIASLISDESDYVFFLRRPWRADKSTPNKMYDRDFYRVHNNHYFKNNYWVDFDKKIKFRYLYNL